MKPDFEVLSVDIAGRIGKLSVAGKTVRTPALLPVVNPHLQPVSPGEMAGMGAEALITNAYIFSRSEQFRERALSEGLHRVLDFDGVIMTDSGSFQLSVYGDVEVTNAETLRFQHAIGSDILVPLDIPTSPDLPREKAEADLALTMGRLVEAREMMPPDIAVAGPVQGGRFCDLREKAGRAVRDLGFSFCPVGAVVPLMETYRFQDLVPVVMAAKKGLTPAACVHLFGAGHPAMFALAVAMGCDFFDSAAYALYAKEGRYLTPHGSYRLSGMNDLPCACAVCRGHTAREIEASPKKERLLSLHNLAVSFAEISRIRQAITDGTLWELVDDRCRSHPSLLRGYRTLLGYREELERHDATSKRRFFYRGAESCQRTEVLRYHRMLSRLTLGERVLIAVGRLGDTTAYDTVLLFRPPFGPYPPALKETFPIGQSEVPEWDEPMMRSGCAGIRALMETHPGTHFTLDADVAWLAFLRGELPGVEVRTGAGQEEGAGQDAF